MISPLTIAALTVAAVLVPGQAWAKDHEVKMLNVGNGGTMVFEPAYLKIEPGDTVRFTPTDSGHNAESIPAMTPTGATPFKGAMGRAVIVRFAKPGLYGYKCLPHFMLGMVGLVQVGAKPDVKAAMAVIGQLPGLARTRMAGLAANAR